MAGHEFVVRTSIPGGFLRSVNQGVPYGKSTTGKARVGVASLEAYSQVDRWAAESSGDIEGFRETEDVAFLEGMSQTMTQLVFYGNSATNPASINGFSAFYNTTNPLTAPNAKNCVSAGGTGTSNTSLWMIGWSLRSSYLLFPRASKAGITMEDRSITPAFDSFGDRFEAYTMWFRHQIGLCPEDWRASARLCNIDVTAAGLAGPNAPDLYALITKLFYLMPTGTVRSSGITKTDAPDEPSTGSRLVLYGNRTILYYLSLQMMRNKGVLLRLEDYAGKVTDNIRGVPVKLIDQLVNSEAAVV